jgi:RHS repeat-associated protein
LTKKNSSNESIEFIYDLRLDNTLSVINSQEFNISYDYDNRLRKDEENKTIDGEEFFLSWNYDAMDRITSEILNGNTITYGYNEQGLDSISGVLDDVVYNEFGKISVRNYSNELDSVFDYNEEMGRLIDISTESIQHLNYTYDNLGNVLEIGDEINSISNRMLYDDLDRLIYANRGDFSGNDKNYEINYTYNSIGNIINVNSEYDNITYIYGDDIAHAPTSISNSPLYIIETDIVYSNDVERIFKLVIGSKINITNINWTINTGTENISSDILFNLSEEKQIIIHRNYNYSEIGDYSVGVDVFSDSYSDYSNIPGIDTSISGNYTYDSNGNLIQDPNYYYEYNDFNRLERIRNNNEDGIILVEYLYDHEGNRILKNISGETTYYIYDNLIRTTNSSGGYDTLYYYHGGTLIGKNDINNSELSYYHPDHLGSTTLITNSSGDVVEETNYKPFGEVLYNGNDRFQYTGKELDKESNLQYYGQRYYSPSLRIFVEPDSIIPDYYNPQSLNRYSYVLNNPYKYVDPDGHDAVEVYFVAGLNVPRLPLGGFGKAGLAFSYDKNYGFEVSGAIREGGSVELGAGAIGPIEVRYTKGIPHTMRLEGKRNLDGLTIIPGMVGEYGDITGSMGNIYDTTSIYTGLPQSKQSNFTQTITFSFG